MCRQLSIISFSSVFRIKKPFFLLNIHPLLIITAVMSLWYGNFLGLLSAGISSVTFMIAYFVAGKDFYFLFTDFANYKFFLMFFLAAVVLGRFRDNYESKILTLKTEKQNLDEDYAKLCDIHEKTKFIKDELKRQIIGAEESILSLYEIAISLESVKPEEIYSELMGIMVRFLKAKTVSVYTLSPKNNMLRLKVRFGGESRLANSIDPVKIPYYDAMIATQAAMKKSDSRLIEMPLMFAPIKHNDTVIGVINIEDMEFDVITDYTFNLFRIIIDWTNKAIAKALTFESFQENQFYRKTGMMRFEPFCERLDVEKKRHEKYGMNYTVLVYKKGTIDIQEIEKRMRMSIRDVDILAYDPKSETIHVLLPATPDEMIPRIEERIQNMFDYKLENGA